MSRTNRIEQLQKVKELIKALPEETPVAFDEELDDDCEWTLEPVTESCDDTRVVGYIVTNAPVVH